MNIPSLSGAAVIGAVLVSGSSLFPSCTNRDNPLPPVTPTNQLVTIAVQDTTALAIDADNYADSGSVPAYFTARLHTVSIAVTGWRGGSVILRIHDAGGGLLRGDSLSCDTVATCVLSGLSTPWSLEYVFRSFSGRLNYRMHREAGGTGGTPDSAFPVRPGCWWQYVVLSGGGPVDTTVISVEGDTLLPGGVPATVWRYQGLFWNRSALSSWSGDTLTLAFTEDELWPPLRLLFPLAAGRVWLANGTGYGAFIVDAVEPVTVPAGRLDNAFVVRHAWSRLDEDGELRYWLAPGVGMVKIHLHREGPFYTDQEWELIAANVPR